ncbi:MAG: hypothetical protein LLG01_07035 [Planctomycetaceae bacterium]|nr:hypothetical protein [Planctomycetaceae bacterium]
MAGDSTKTSACPRDTDPEIYRRWIEGLRRMSGRQRLALAMNLTDEVRALSRRAIARAHPDWSEAQRQIEFVRIHYGKAMAQGLRQMLLGAEP